VPFTKLRITIISMGYMKAKLQISSYGNL